MRRTSTGIARAKFTLLLKVRSHVHVDVFGSLSLSLFVLLSVCSAPTETTLYDFVRMIWQLRIQSIVMVTRLFEDGKVMRRRAIDGHGKTRALDCLSSTSAFNIGRTKAKKLSTIFVFDSTVKLNTLITRSVV
jgi:hypothetical protein